MRKRKPTSQATRKQISDSLRNRARYGSVESRQKRIRKDTLTGLKTGALVGLAEGLTASALHAGLNRDAIQKGGSTQRARLLGNYAKSTGRFIVSRGLTGAGLGAGAGLYRTGQKKLGAGLGLLSASSIPFDNPLTTYNRVFKLSQTGNKAKRGSL